MKPCEIVQDLLPLYAENLCSEDSRAYVEEHLKTCAECRVMHEAMTKSIQVLNTRRNAKKNLPFFKRRKMTPRVKRALLIAVCVLAVLLPIGWFAKEKISIYLYRPQLVRQEPIISNIGELSDGSLYLMLCYTEEDVYINNAQSYQYPDDPSTLYIKFGSSPIHNMGNHKKRNGGHWHEFLISTEESFYKYKFPQGEQAGFNYPYTRVVLSGTDGERVLWEAGDEIPAAHIRGEALLQSEIDSKWFVPVNEN